MQERRNWDLLMHEKLLPLLSSPRAKKKKNILYVEARRKTSATEASKQAMLQKLTNLKEDGGVLKGGAHKDTYDHKMKTKIKKKLQKKEDKTKAEEIKKTQKKFATIKMIATKLNKKKEKEKDEGEAAEGAGAAASSTD